MEFILNVNEVGSQEWADRKKRDAVILHSARDHKIKLAVSRKDKAVQQQHMSTIGLIIFRFESRLGYQ
jgi:hypothetical protein